MFRLRVCLSRRQAGGLGVRTSHASLGGCTLEDGGALVEARVKLRGRSGERVSLCTSSNRLRDGKITSSHEHERARGSERGVGYTERAHRRVVKVDMRAPEEVDQVLKALGPARYASIRHMALKGRVVDWLSIHLRYVVI